jgi:iron(III) transport system substrate-binding protein
MKHRFAFVLAFAYVAALMTLLASTVTAQEQSGGVVNVYSARHSGVLEQTFQKFTELTGIEVRVSQGESRALLERLRAEGDQTPADVLLAIDAGVLSLAAEEGLLQAIDSELLTEYIDESQRDPEGRWFGLSQRVRTIAYNPETVDAALLTDYASLADPQFKGRLCLRPASHIYTVSLVSSLIYNLGEEGAQAVVEGWVANEPIYIDSDTRILETIAAGGCDVALVNHYYYANKISADPAFADTVKLAWANQGEESTGVFYNINGAGVTTAAANVENAIKLIEFLASPEGQAGDSTGLPGGNNEFPTNFNVEPAPALLELGEFTLDTGYALWDYGTYQGQALTLLETVGYGFSEN